MSTTRTAIAAAVVSVLVLSQGACSRDASKRDAVPPDEATALLDQRIWLDKEPRSQTDQFHVLVFNRRQGSGVMQRGTIWKGHYEIFLYEAQKGRIDMKLPGSQKRVQTGFGIEREKHGRADTKLTLERTPQGPTVYYGFRFDGHDAGDIDAWLAAQFGDVPAAAN
ncbi:MAG TPA: hypothetical protein VM261_23965 [Kofleriaceae bacterium]|nr:hypothetical protein [Kofleriaceae bacterium]